MQWLKIGIMHTLFTLPVHSPSLVDKSLYFWWRSKVISGSTEVNFENIVYMYLKVGIVKVFHTYNVHVIY